MPLWADILFFVLLALVVIVGVAGKTEERNKAEELRKAQLDYYKKG